MRLVSCLLSCSVTKPGNCVDTWLIFALNTPNSSSFGVSRRVLSSPLPSKPVALRIGCVARLAIQVAIAPTIDAINIVAIAIVHNNCL